MSTVDKSPAQILRTLADVLGDEDCDPDDLIHAFGEVEAGRVEIAEFLSSLLDQTSE